MNKEQLEEEIYKELFFVIDVLKDNGLENTNELKNNINSRCVRGSFGYFFINELYSMLKNNYHILKEKNYDYFNDNKLYLSGLTSVEKFIEDNWSELSKKDKKKIFTGFSKIFNYCLKYFK